MDTHAPIGRRERKKAATRAAIVDAATALFLERSFDDVTVREIADRADVSPTTVFAHFPRKEALVFHHEEAQHERLVAAVRDRPAGTSVSAALHAHFRAELAGMDLDREGASGRLFALIDQTPALQGYATQMWLRREDALTAALTDEFGLPEPTPELRAYVRFALQLELLADTDPDPTATLDAGFRLLDHGWNHYLTQRSPHTDPA
ncbi:TetR/AcrR family transcriptional regulator [Catenuloplanes atrovinosus]|uniref:AcrR family transcriptional regulator n=1 Tax=Catenuloplanes atrovinosus TaxID=137266 RepID=A0AAE4CAW7_9ACTN|nr:helix-turn-helix domain-containing protein [Catenuloplanes atrovinosus]MDR7277422.1 AcrR family transcriptional regulator [Catenuloplanes atrovinosus]